MATLCGDVFLSVENDLLGLQKRTKQAQETALLMNKVGMKDGTGEFVIWCVCENPFEERSIAIMAVAQDQESSVDIADFLHLSGLVTNASDIGITREPTRDGEDQQVFVHRIIVDSRKINRAMLDNLMAGKKISAPCSPYTFH